MFSNSHNYSCIKHVANVCASSILLNVVKALLVFCIFKKARLNIDGLYEKATISSVCVFDKSIQEADEIYKQ